MCARVTCKAALVIALAAAPPIFARIARVTSDSQTTTKVPENSRGLKTTIEALLSDARSGDSERLRNRVQELLIPAPTIWFGSTFAETAGTELVADYEKVTADLRETFPKLLTELAADPKLSIELEEAQPTQKEIQAAIEFVTRKGVKLYRVRLQKSNKDGQDLGHFAYVGGAFRALGSILPIPAGDGIRLRLVGPDQTIEYPNLIEQRRPRYPPIAKASYIQGRVSVLATLAQDGSLKNLRALEGHGVLVDAVRTVLPQWRYTPLRIGGQPTEVSIVIETLFEIRM